MKNRFLFTTFILVLCYCVACNSNKDKSSPTAESRDITKDPDYQKGLGLIASSNCMTCHTVDQPLTGPAYRDVANKYAGADTAAKYLSQKIIHGGAGVWGEVMMPPNAVSEEDAMAMAKYILLLKNR